MDDSEAGMSPKSNQYTSNRGIAGFSLIELIAAMAVLSVVSVMAVQALGVTVTLRRVLEQADDKARQLSWTLTLLRRDLEAAIPMHFEGFQRAPAPAFDAFAGDGRFSISISGHPRHPDEPGMGFARVSWQFEPASGTLTRHVVPLLQPRMREESQKYPLLTDVTAFSIEGIGEDQPAADSLDALPNGFEVRLVTRSHGPLTIRVAR